MSKRIVGKLIFGVTFIAIACVGASFVAKGVFGILNNNQSGPNSSLDPDRPVVEVTPQKPNKPSNGSSSNSNTNTFRPNLGFNVSSQAIHWGAVKHNQNQPDTYPSDLQYKNLVKIKGLSGTHDYRQGVLLDFYQLSQPHQNVPRELLLEMLNHINVKGYVHFDTRNSNNSHLGQNVELWINDDKSLRGLIENKNYLELKSFDESRNPLVPKWMMIHLEFSADVWYFNEKPYKFELPSHNMQNNIYRGNYKVDINISGLN